VKQGSFAAPIRTYEAQSLSFKKTKGKPLKNRFSSRIRKTDIP